VDGVVMIEIQADDLARSREFYGAVFGWQFVLAHDLPIEYWRFRAGDIEGGMLQRPAPAPGPEQGTNAFVCTVEVADFDAAANRIADHGGRVALDRMPIPGRGWQGYFLDPSGNTFGVFAADSAA
jgi:predicted enzyme related to lactoylglutathione lyase